MKNLTQKPSTLRELWKDKRAVSTAVIELLMIAMVVVTAVGVYAVYSGISAPTSQRAQQHITVDSVLVVNTTSPFNVTAYIRNDGASTVTLANWYLYDSGGSQTDTGTVTGAITVGTLSATNVTGNTALTTGQMYKLRIVLDTGIFGEYVFTA